MNISKEEKDGKSVGRIKSGLNENFLFSHELGHTILKHLVLNSLNDI
jgi:hypothetical protein